MAQRIFSPLRYFYPTKIPSGRPRTFTGRSCEEIHTAVSKRIAVFFSYFKSVFPYMLKNGGYQEVSYEEFCRRKDTDGSYAQKFYTSQNYIIPDASWLPIGKGRKCRQGREAQSLSLTAFSVFAICLTN